MDPTGFDVYFVRHSGLSLVGVLCIRSILSVFPSDLPGVNPATLNEMILYCRLMAKWSGLGDSTELSRVGLSHMWILLRRPLGVELISLYPSSPSSS
jgi:hypothetical protein